VNVVIPAAGLGVRFRPLSRIMPKELLPMGGKPLIHHALEEADRAGFEQAVVVLSPTKSSIREYFELPETSSAFQRPHIRRRDARGVRLVAGEVRAQFGRWEADERSRSACSQLTDRCSAFVPDPSPGSPGSMPSMANRGRIDLRAHLYTIRR
jgi:hypothetical protein